ncbi:CocE/NonD family hydrolase [Sphingomonas echinoides]|uniref:CocE/NonD family hydrolase n=1 Tax=Sphingomonas echinoides TaxID=59803 RepID=UPI0024137B13|nr:CocE/NonD family hydrolase [Sphingomonas echinoides]
MKHHHLFLSAAIALVTAPVATSAQSTAPAAQQPTDIAVREKVMVPMRDGIRIAVDLYMPAGAAAGQRFPVVLQRWSYGRKANNTAATGAWFARHGYVFVSSDMRGNNDSEGVYYMHDPVNDPRDGHDMVEWLATQPWSTGAIGTYGISYGGHTQFNTALGKPPHLKAQFLINAVTDYHDGGGAWSQGAWLGDHNLSHTLGAILTMHDNADKPAVKAQAEAMRKDYDRVLALPAAEQAKLLAFSPPAQRWFSEWLAHPDYDAYWKSYGINPDRYRDYPDIPMLFYGSWYDHMQRPFLKAYLGLKAAHRSETRMISGPWDHGRSVSHNGDAEFGPDGEGHPLEAADAWFRQYLKGEQPATPASPVRLFVMGTGDGHRTAEGLIYHGGYWRDEAAYPLARAKPTSYYLQGNGLLGSSPATSTTSTALIADPAHPVPTIYTRIGGAFDQRCKPTYKGCTDSRPLNARADVKSFSTAPLDRDVEVTGPVSVTLHFRTDVKDTDFAVKLIDEYPASAAYPDGVALTLSDALRRARYRDTLDKATLLTPGKTYTMTIEVPPTSNVFKKGHRIRLDIAGSNFPKFDVNPNTGEPIQHHTRQQVAHSAILHDPAHPSMIVLPIVPAAPR